MLFQIKLFLLFLLYLQFFDRSRFHLDRVVFFEVVVFLLLLLTAFAVLLLGHSRHVLFHVLYPFGMVPLDQVLNLLLLVQKNAHKRQLVSTFAPPLVQSLLLLLLNHAILSLNSSSISHLSLITLLATYCWPTRHSISQRLNLLFALFEIDLLC